MPNLHRMQDISEFLIGGENGQGYVTDGGTSGSEADTDAEVEVLDTAPRKVLSAKARTAVAEASSASRDGADDNDVASQAGTTTTNGENVERRGVKLVELGPRMRLRMTKIEEGLCSGKVMWHEYVEKSREEVRELEKRWEQRRKEKEARRKQQKENVEQKKRAKEAAKAGNKDGGEADEEEERDDEGYGMDEMDVDAYDSDLFDEMAEEAKMTDDEMVEDTTERGTDIAHKPLARRAR